MMREAKKCPRKDCNGQVHFKSRVIICFKSFKSEHLGVTDIECDACDFVMWNVFGLRCQTSDDDLVKMIDKDAQEKEFGISITEAQKKYNISTKTAIRVFKKLGGMDDE